MTDLRKAAEAATPTDTVKPLAAEVAERLRLGAPNACEVHDVAADVIDALTARIRELEALVYAPGMWRCAKCKFTLIQSNLNMGDGTVTARDEPGDKCPNCDGPLWRVSWKQDAMENMEIAEKLQLENVALKKDNATAFAAGVEAAAKVAKTAWLNIPVADIVDADVMNDFCEQLSANIAALSPPTGMVMVPAEATEAVAQAICPELESYSPTERFTYRTQWLPTAKRQARLAIEALKALGWKPPQ
jgi:hypothetical protein